MLIVTLMFAIPPELASIVLEQDQNKLENMLRLSGMSIKIQILTKRVVEAIFLVPGVIFVSIVGKIVVTPFISFGVLFLITLFVVIQFALAKDVISYGFGRGPLAKAISITFMILMILFTVLQTLLKTNITPG